MKLMMMKLMMTTMAAVALTSAGVPLNGDQRLTQAASAKTGRITGHLHTHPRALPQPVYHAPRSRSERLLFWTQSTLAA